MLNTGVRFYLGVLLGLRNVAQIVKNAQSGHTEWEWVWVPLCIRERERVNYEQRDLDGKPTTKQIGQSRR